MSDPLNRRKGPKMHPRHRYARLNLEALEGRDVPASVSLAAATSAPAANILVGDVEAQIVQAQALQLGIQINVPSLAQRITLLSAFAASGPAPSSLSVVLTSDIAAQAAEAQAFAAVFPSVQAPVAQPAPAPTQASPDAGATGFTGRLVLPGTGVQALVANGDGLMSQAPGLFLSSGSSGTSEDSKQPAPSSSSLGADEETGDGADGQVSDDVWCHAGRLDVKYESPA